jgi:hypothetical protein
MRNFRNLALLVSVCALAHEALAQTFPLEINQPKTPINFQSPRGAPLSATVNNPIGSDGRAPTVTDQSTAGLPTTAPTAKQFQGFVSYGALARPRTPLNLNSNINFAKNAEAVQLPRGKSDNIIKVVMTSAQVGAPFMMRRTAFLFGSIIPVPDTDENGQILPSNLFREDYWLAEPYSVNRHTNAPYYWSPHARTVFAIQPGPISITWKRNNPTTIKPSDYDANPSKYSLETGNYYRLFTASYVVSGSAVKTPRSIYWTEGVFRRTSKPVAVPAARVGAIQFVFNSNFPERVTEEYRAPGQSFAVQTNRLEETRTLWYDAQLGQIYAYNREGRVFVELLGDLREDGIARKHLGYEIVDVHQQTTPADLTIDLGERITPYDDPLRGSDLQPEPVVAGSGAMFHFQWNTQAASQSSQTGSHDLYAIRETRNLNDLLIHWMEEGQLGLRWPLRLARYKLAWPEDVSKYSHFVRPRVATEVEAKDTAVPLPTENTPVIAYQDPLDRPRAKLTEDLKFYTFLEPGAPAHRTLLRFTSGENIAFERVFSWLKDNLTVNSSGQTVGTSFANTVATTLTTWNPATETLSWPDELRAPRVVEQVAPVGDRIRAPSSELGAGVNDSYWSGYLRESEGNSFHPAAYSNPFASGFTNANRGAIIPVNAIPGRNRLEVWWFRKNAIDVARGFKAFYWPSVIGRYTIQWPVGGSEIVLASNKGSGPLASLQAKGNIYRQDDRNLAGFNPNEEHALMLGGQAYALRDDLNITSGGSYSSDPFVLVEYTESDGRPAVATFKVLREKPTEGIVFDYITSAGQILQAPMPLPFLPPPVEGTGSLARNFNTEPGGAEADLPVNWSEATHGSGSFALYKRFTYRDRKEGYWVYRGLHAGEPGLQAGKYNTTSRAFEALAAATAVVGQDFEYSIHASRRIETLVLQPQTGTTLPNWLTVDGLTLKGRPFTENAGSSTLSLRLTTIDDGTSVTLSLPLTVATSGSVVAQARLQIISNNSFAGGNVTYVGRPPYLATSPVGTNSFTMRFYYKNQAEFSWPGRTMPPAVGAIVPYLRPKDSNGAFVGEASSKNTMALDIVYRPVWPVQAPQMRYGDTLTTPKNGLPSIRGQNSLQMLYQQSIAKNITAANVSAVLHDPTREKSYDITQQGLEKIPDTVRTDTSQGRSFFPNLPPHLAQRLFFDPNRGKKGHLVFRGEFKDEALGEKYVHLNVLDGTDLNTVKALCPSNDTINKSKWDAAVAGLSTQVETFYENPKKPGTFIPNPALTYSKGIDALTEVTDDDTAVDSYALSASGPGSGYITLISGNGLPASTPPGSPVSLHIIKVTSPLYTGEVKVIPSTNPLDEQVTFQHSADLAGRFDEYYYQWKIAPPVDGVPPDFSSVSVAAEGTGLPRYLVGGAGIQALVDNYVVMRYRPNNPNHPLYQNGTGWSEWSTAQLAEGWIKRVLAGINPFNQRVSGLFNNQVNTDVSLLTQAGQRWEGNIALNGDTMNNFGLIEIYETILRRGKMLSIDAGINFAGANDALLLAAGYLNDLYMMIGNEAWADAANPTIGIGTADRTYGDIATALFAFKGQVSSLMEEELALLRGKDDFLLPGVEVAPVYNRLFWNYTRGIDAGEVIYALNYNILEDANQGVNGIVNADDARKLFPQGHGDAYGHYLTALKGYYSLLISPNFTWVPRVEAVLVLGKPVSVDYLDERKFAAAAAAVARAGKAVFDLTWRRDLDIGVPTWNFMSPTRTNDKRKVPSTRYWGMDHWASRTGQGAYLNWVVGNSMLPETDPDPNHEGIQKIDRSVVVELQELPATMESLQTALDNAEGDNTPLGLPRDSIAFDISPSKVVGHDEGTHFEQIFGRATVALNNALVSFDEAKDLTRLMRSEQDSTAGFQAEVASQELSYDHSLIELFGTPYPDDIGPGKTYKTGYEGPDLLHFMYVDLPELTFNGALTPQEKKSFKIDIQKLPSTLATNLTGTTVISAIDQLNQIAKGSSPSYATNHYVEFQLDPHGFFSKPEDWSSRRKSPGRIQQAISEIITAQAELNQALGDAEGAKGDLDQAIELFQLKVRLHNATRDDETVILSLEQVLEGVTAATEILEKIGDWGSKTLDDVFEATAAGIPTSFIAGLAAGGDVASAARGAVKAVKAGSKSGLDIATVVSWSVQKALEFATSTTTRWLQFDKIAPREWELEVKEAISGLASSLGGLQSHFVTINSKLRRLDDAKRNFAAAVAEGDRIQKERENFRKRAAAVVQGFRTRDAAFRIFRNEKLERYRTLFDLAARYTFLAASAYDYDTGLLGTEEGNDVFERIFKSRALGVVKSGEPQFAGSKTGDSGLSGVLAELKNDWNSLKGRLGFNNPDTYGTTVSLRTENFRILPGSDGDANWQDILQRGRMDDLLADDDVRGRCMQIKRDGGLPVPGIVVEFSTTVADGLNLFGKTLAAGDHNFSPSLFATKIYALGVALDGYRGMSDLAANGGAVGFAGGTSPSDPSAAFFDTKALSATPYVYLIPVGEDSMRSPPLGDVSHIRTWTVADVAIPMPFNLGASAFSSKPLWQSSDALSEELFAQRKHQSFRPVSSTSVFTGDLVPTQYTNRRLIGRSVWNSKWKLVIPGHTLLNNPAEGLNRFIQTVKDIKLHFVTYSYAGN